MTPRRTLLAWAAASLALSPPAFADWQAGIDAFKARDFEQAVAEFRQYVDERPDQHAGHLMLGRSLFAAERYRAAASALRRAVSLRPGDWQAYVMLGQAFTYRGRHKKAEVSLRTALGLADGEDRNLVLNWIGFVLYRQGRYAEAAEAYHSAGNPEAAQEVREIQRRVAEDAEDLEALVEAIRRGGPPKWLPGDPVRGSDGARTR
ncbi:MAG: tetratricopeptide repeat protein [Acidobacteriota bacterium]|nr:tetratricopeptide repeat protein [Acidobacteriota bacterium]